MQIGAPNQSVSSQIEGRLLPNELEEIGEFQLHGAARPFEHNALQHPNCISGKLWLDHGASRLAHKGTGPARHRGLTRHANGNAHEKRSQDAILSEQPELGAVLAIRLSRKAPRD